MHIIYNIVDKINIILYTHTHIQNNLVNIQLYRARLVGKRIESYLFIIFIKTSSLKVNDDFNGKFTYVLNNLNSRWNHSIPNYSCILTFWFECKKSNDEKLSENVNLIINHIC
jgi:hypothetical protein